MNLNSIFLLSNGIFTLFLGFFVAYLLVSNRKVERNSFYLLFSLGFIIYSIEIILRWISAEYNPSQSLTTVALTGVSLFLFSLGFWSISRRKSLLAVILPCYFSGYLLVGLWFANLIPYEIAIICVFLGYLPVIFMLLIHVAILRKMVDVFIFGWFFLLLTNFILLGQGWIADVFAIFSKILILRGMIDQDFVILSQRIRNKLILNPVMPITSLTKEGGIRLVIPSNNSSAFSSKFNWIEKKALENTEKGTDTYVLSFQDVFPHSALRRIKWINTEKNFILLFSSSSQEIKKEFTVFPMEITHIGATLTELANKYKNSETSYTIILTNLSLIIHTFGVQATYRLLSSKLGSLRESKANVYAFIYPNTHTDKTVIPLFENISDEVIKL